MVPLQQAGVFELRQHAIDGGQARVQTLRDQLLIHVLGREVAHLAFLKQAENFEARRSGP